MGTSSFASTASATAADGCGGGLPSGTCDLWRGFRVAATAAATAAAAAAAAASSDGNSSSAARGGGAAARARA